MDIRTLFVPLDGTLSDRRRLDAAYDLADMFGARVMALHAQQGDGRLINALGDGVSERTIRDVLERRDQDEQRARATFNAWCGATAPGGVEASFHVERGDYAEPLIRHARYADLTVLTAPEPVGRRRYDPIVESRIVMESGRPVLIAPAHPVRIVGEAVAVAWDASAEATHAVVAAWPFLSRARRILVVTVLERHAHAQDASMLVALLAEHGLAAEHTVVPDKGNVGATILDVARQAGCDLLVMGAYSRNRWRERLFGGTTDDLLCTADLPIVMTH